MKLILSFFFQRKLLPRRRISSLNLNSVIEEWIKPIKLEKVYNPSIFVITNSVNKFMKYSDEFIVQLQLQSESKLGLMPMNWPIQWLHTLEV